MLLCKEILKLLARTNQIIAVSDLRSLAAGLRQISKLVTGDMLEKVEGIVKDVQVSGTVDNSGAVKRKFTTDAATPQQDTKLRKTEGSGASSNDTTTSEGDAGSWVCASCTFLNHPSLEACEMCDNSRHAFAMLQMQLEDMKQRTRVFEPPSTWQPVDPGTRLRKVTLAETDADYLEVSKVMSTFGFQTSSSIMSSIVNVFKPRSRPIYTIKRIERIENLHMYQMYMIKKDQMGEENGSVVRNEQMLWHGTSLDCVDNIATYGFNRSHCGKHGTAFGKGVYFSTGPHYSSNAKYAKPDSSGLQYMFYSRVLTGRHTIGHADMVEPPAFLNKLGRFNSLADDIRQPSIFVIFHDAQAYPEFLITFSSG